MTRSLAHLLDPALADAVDSCAGDDSSAEPLEDRLYLPVGVDPHGDICGVVLAHPYPQSKEVLTQRIIRNNNLQDMLWLIETADRLAASFQAQPVYVFEATNVFWRAQRNFLHRAGYATATVCGRQTNHARGTVTRAAKNDLKDAYNITKVFKQGESHATRLLPEPLASLREYCRLHQFLTSYSVAIQNRMHCLRYQMHPEFDTLFADPVCATTVALMEAELVQPQRLLQCDLTELTALIHQTSHGKLDRARAAELQQSARFTFATPYAAEGSSYSLKLLAQAYEYIQCQLLPPLAQRIQATQNASDFPIHHHLSEIKYFGPLVIGTFLSELGLPQWFPTVDSVVAWFGLDPAVSESANHPTGASHLTKRGTKYGRRMMWLVGRWWSQYVTEGRQLFLQERQEHQRPYDAAVCVVAAKLVRIAFAMVRDGSHFDLAKAF
ncbi:MAG: transposase [Actinobacteria bacterium]|nr:transposase [Actinomycetota bacterium]